MMLDATRHYEQPLTAERLFAWHASLVPDRPQRHDANQGGRLARRQHAARCRWSPARSGRSVSTSKRRRRHDSDREMRDFLDWFNGNAETDWVVKAGLAHLWFVTIHPFDDGNGRIARAIADMALARSEHSPQRFYSMSAQIRQERARLLRHSGADAERRRWTSRPGWNGSSAASAARSTARKRPSEAVLAKARFWEIDWAILAERTPAAGSQPLARWLRGEAHHNRNMRSSRNAPTTPPLRDILPLVEHGILVRNPEGGRSTSYALAKIS